MKLPLFISAKPFVGLTSMSVMIGKGKWRFCYEDNSTELDYFVNGSPFSDPEILVENTSKVSCVVTKAGTKSINVNVETLD